METVLTLVTLLELTMVSVLEVGLCELFLYDLKVLNLSCAVARCGRLVRYVELLELLPESRICSRLRDCVLGWKYNLLDALSFLIESL